MRRYLTPNQSLKLDKPGQTNLWLRGSGKYRLELAKAGVEVRVFGRWRLQKSQRLDLQLIINHAAPQTKAATDLKAAVFDQAQAHLQGLIRIEPHCPVSESFLSARVMLLSAQAHATTIPELEILSDDVKCSHAASTSPPDEQQLFYLMSRGLSSQAAQNLLVAGFLQAGIE